MAALARALSAETLKLNRTLALAMVFVSPLVVVVLNILNLVRMSQFSPEVLPEGWRYMIQNSLALWIALMLPLFITLETALMAGLEHNSQQWKHLFALPIPRGSVYAAKQIMAFGVSALGLIVLLIAAWLSGLIVMALGVDTVTFEAQYPWGLAFQVAGFAYLLSAFIVAIHTWVANRWASFPVAAGVGMTATVINFFLINSETWSKIFPWSLPINALLLMIDGTPVTAQPVIIALVGAVVVSIVGGWDVIRRDVL